MIANQTIGRSFKGVLQYVFKKEEATFAFSNLANTPNDGINRMANELIAVSSQRPNLSRSVAHIQFSPNPEDNISDEKFEEFIKAWLEEMGYIDCLYAVAFHEDTDIKHAHVVISRVTLYNEVVSESNNYAKSIKITRKLEKNFNLIPTLPKGNDHAPKWQKNKIIKPHEFIKKSIKSVGATAPSMNEFIKSMKALGIDVELKISSKAGIAQGISFNYKNYSVTGSKVGYSIKNLEKKLGIKYEQPERNTGIFSRRALDPETGKPEACERFARKVENCKRATNRAANEPTISIFQRLTERVKSTIDKFRESIREIRPDDGKLSRVVDQFEANNRAFSEIFKVLKSSELADKISKKRLLMEIGKDKSNDSGIDITLN